MELVQVRKKAQESDNLKSAFLNNLLHEIPTPMNLILGEHSEPKWKLITNHTARKTFITNSVVPGMNTKTIKDITGHKKDSVFNKYVKISEEFKKLEMNRTWDNIIIKPKDKLLLNLVLYNE